MSPELKARAEAHGLQIKQPDSNAEIFILRFESPSGVGSNACFCEGEVEWILDLLDLKESSK